VGTDGEECRRYSVGGWFSRSKQSRKRNLARIARIRGVETGCCRKKSGCLSVRRVIIRFRKIIRSSCSSPHKLFIHRITNS